MPQIKNTTKDFVVKIEDKVASFSPFVSMKEKGVVYLYKANQVGPMKAVYTLTNKLGVPNQVLEYVKNGIDKSAIGENNPFIGFTESDVVNVIPEAKVKVEEQTQPESIMELDNIKILEINPKSERFGSESKYISISYPSNIYISKQIGYITAKKLQEVDRVFRNSNPFGTDKLDSETISDRREFAGLRNTSKIKRSV